MATAKTTHMAATETAAVTATETAAAMTTTAMASAATVAAAMGKSRGSRQRDTKEDRGCGCDLPFHRSPPSLTCGERPLIWASAFYRVFCYGVVALH